MNFEQFVKGQAEASAAAVQPKGTAAYTRAALALELDITYLARQATVWLSKCRAQQVKVTS